MNEMLQNTTSVGGDEETAALLTATIDRLLSDLCTPKLIRDAEAVDSAGMPNHAAVSPLWSELQNLGLADALLADDAQDGALGWSEVRGLIESCGWWGLPLPLPETLAGQALCRAAGVTPVQGMTTLAAASRESDRVLAYGVAYAGLAGSVLVSLPSGDADRQALWQFETARAAVQRSGGIGQARSNLCWLAAEGRELGLLPAGVDALTAGAAIRSAQIAGACAKVLEMTTTYASDRVQFGRPISKFQAIQQQLALAGEWTAMAAMASQLALAGPGLALDRQRVASAKQVASTAVQHCCEIAHAVHGAIGVTAEYDLQLFTRRLWAWAADFGSAVYWARVLGQGLLERAPRYSWDEVVRAASV